jgi:hypothetical protein
MKKILILTAVAGLSFLPSVANAQERLGEGAMGALAGALVGGPIGLVAGGVVGYTPGRRLRRAGVSKGIGIIVMSIIAGSLCPLSPVSGAIIRIYEATHRYPA